MKETQDRCNGIRTQITTTQSELATLEQRITKIGLDIANATQDVERKRTIVRKLEEELALARTAYENAKNNLDQLNEQRTTYIQQRTELTIRIEELKSQSASCQTEIERITILINGISTKDLEPQINQITNDINKYEQTKRTKETRIKEIDILIPGLEGQRGNETQNLVYLRTQLTITQEELRKAHIAGNDANTLVLQARQNLQAASARFAQESTSVTTATQNLEKARAEEALARLALEEVIAHYTDALPYAIVPNGNGQTQVGTPAGNNPSGSALGAIRLDGKGAQGSFQVNWVHYLSQAYGAGVNPAFTGSVTELYPFTFSSTVSKNVVTNTNIRTSTAQTTTQTSACSGGQIQSVTGTITQVSDEGFTISLNDGSSMRVNVAPCTQMNANVANYSMTAGDVAVVKGAKASNNGLNGQSVTCLA